MPPDFDRSTARSFAELGEALKGFFDPDWYLSRYPDVADFGGDPLLHFISFGAAEGRDPNRFFDSAWYVAHNPDVASSGQHPRFDAAYYVDQHPEAAGNPLLYHILSGLARGWLTEKPIAIQDYLPSG